jgi:hypothetical protein
LDENDCRGISVARQTGHNLREDEGVLGLIGMAIRLAVIGLLACGALLLSGCTVTPAETPPLQVAAPSLPTQEALNANAPQRLVNAAASRGAAPNVPMLSQSEMLSLHTQLMACWTPPVGVAEAKDLVVIIRFALNRDGTISGEPLVVNRGNTSLFQLAAEAAKRAVRRCQPFRLPDSKYEAWRELEVNFDADRSTSPPQRH